MTTAQNNASTAANTHQGGLVPRIRFPEFEGSPTWKTKALGDLLTVGNGRDYKHLGVGSIPVYGSGGYMLSVDAYLHDGESVCIGRKGTINRPMFLTGKFWTVDTLFYTHSFRNFLPRFAFLIFQSIDWLKHNEAGGVPSLQKTNIIKIQVPTPTLPEQQKIADCLSSLDDLIAAESQKLATLKVHKKGLMQELFPQEGETVPRLRFPEFEGEWEVKRLGEVASIQLGKMLDQKKHIQGKLYPYLNNMSVRWNRIETQDLPQMNFTEKESKKFSVESGYVLVCEGGEPGRAAVWEGTSTDIKYQKALHRVRFKIPFKPSLLVAYLESIAGTNQFERLFTGGGIKHLTQEVFAGLVIPIAPYAEQQKIAAVLSSLDDRITAQAERIEALRVHKKGLMQGLFPVMEG